MTHQSKSLIWDKIKKRDIELFIILYSFLYLYVITSSTYIGDDILNSVAHGTFYFNGLSMTDLINKLNIHWMADGRFFPLSLYGVCFFRYVKGVYVYKLIIVLSVCFNIFIYGGLISKITDSRKTKLILMLISVLPFQFFTTYHNALYSYNLLMQVMFTYCILYMFFLLLYLEQNKVIYLIISVLLFAMGLATYEMMFAFTLFLPFILWRFSKSKKKGFLISIPYGLVFTAFALINYLLKKINLPKYDGIELNLNIFSICRTFFIQFIAAFPLSNYFLSPRSQLLNYSFQGIISSIKIEDLVLIFLFLLLLYKIFNLSKDRLTKYDIINLSLLGAGLMIFPAILLSLTIKYQRELHIGTGYLPIYIQYFGVAILLYLIYMGINLLIKLRFFNRLFKCIACVIISFIIIISQQNARAYISYQKVPSMGFQTYVTDSITSGLMNAIQKEDTVILKRAYVGEENVFYSYYARKSINAITTPEYINHVFNKNSAQNIIFKDLHNTYITDFEFAQYAGMVKLAPVSSMNLSKKDSSITKIYVPEAYLYVAKCDNMLTYIAYENSKKEVVYTPIDSYSKIVDNKTGSIIHIKFDSDVLFDSIHLSTAPVNVND